MENKADYRPAPGNRIKEGRQRSMLLCGIVCMESMWWTGALPSPKGRGHMRCMWEPATPIHCHCFSGAGIRSQTGVHRAQHLGLAESTRRTMAIMRHTYLHSIPTCPPSTQQRQQREGRTGRHGTGGTARRDFGRTRGHVPALSARRLHLCGRHLLSSDCIGSRYHATRRFADCTDLCTAYMPTPAPCSPGGVQGYQIKRRDNETSAELRPARLNHY